MKKLFGNSGFTLVEIMIATAILAGLSLVVMNLTKQATSTQKKFQTDIDADFITKEISGILANSNSCLASQLIGKDATLTPAGVITDINGKYAVSSTTGYGSSQIKVTSYQISNTGFSEITDTNTETVLVINFAMPKVVSTTVATIKPRRIKLIITKSGSNIATCKSAWVNQQDYWTKAGNDIFYNSGNVGIGTVSPSVPLDVAGYLHVSGNIAPTLPTQGGYIGWNALTGGAGEMDFMNQQGIGNGGFAFFNSSNTTKGSTLMMIQGNGNVGIGMTSPTTKLDVDGGIRPGSSGVATGGACASEGTFAYDLAAHAPVFCNSSGQWAAMGAVTAGIPIYVCPQYCIRWGPGPWLSTQSTCNNNYDYSGACVLVGKLVP